MRKKNSLKDSPKKNSNPEARTAPPASGNPVSHRAGAALVCAVAIAASVAGILNEFAQDDLSILVESTRLHGFAALRDILTLPYWPPPAAPDLYRPVASILLAMQYAIGDGAPIVFRVVSYALYAAASVGLYRLALRLVAPSIALAVGVLFAAHAVHVEAVALAVTQNELLVGALATVMVTLYVDRRRAGDGVLSARDWTILGACYALASFSKEQGLLLPAFLVLAEIFLSPARPFSARVSALWRGFAGLAVIAATMIAIRTAVLSGVVGPTMIAEALRGQTMGGRLLTMLKIVPEWARLFVWPAHLRAEYSPREFVASTSFGGAEATGLAIVAFVALVIWTTRRSAPTVAFGLSWMCVALFPVSNVVIPTGILLAERTMFLPSMGFVLAVGGAMAFAASRRPDVAPRTGAFAAAAVAILALLGVARSVERQRVWRNPVALTLASVEDAPLSWRVQQVYGDMLFNQGHRAEGIAAFRRAIDLAPEPWRPRNLLAGKLRVIGDDKDAVMLLRASLADDPRQIQTLAALPPALIGAGLYAEAKRLADSIIVAEHAPPLMVQMSHIADSAMKVNAPPGSIRIGVPRQ